MTKERTRTLQRRQVRKATKANAPLRQYAGPKNARRIAATLDVEEACHRCGEPLETGPWGFTDCPACNPNPARG